MEFVKSVKLEPLQMLMETVEIAQLIKDSSMKSVFVLLDSSLMKEESVPNAVKWQVLS